MRACTVQRAHMARTFCDFAEHLSVMVMDTGAFALPLKPPRVPNIRAKQGQTFPEMMIIVAIIAILAAVIVQNLFTARAEAQISAIEETEKAIAAAAELYFDDYGVYPPSGNVTPALFGGNGNAYYNGSPRGYASNSPYVFFYPWNGINSYAVYLNARTIDGSLLQNLMTHSSGFTQPPIAGYQYYVIYQQSMGVVAYP